ncbi:hypothetical protein D3C76_1040520 [compost metagenome]
MESAMAADPLGAVLTVVVHLIEQALQMAEMALGEFRHGNTNGETFQSAAYLEHLTHFLDVQAAHDRAAIGPQRHQAIGIQAPKGFAHRHAAHADFTGDVLGNQPLAGAVTSFANGLQEKVVSLLLGSDRLALGIGRGEFHQCTFCIFVSNYPQSQNSTLRARLSTSLAGS